MSASVLDSMRQRLIKTERAANLTEGEMTNAQANQLIAAPVRLYLLKEHAVLDQQQLSQVLTPCSTDSLI